MFKQHGPRLWAKALLLTIVGVQGAYGYDSGHCYCAEDMDELLWNNRNNYTDEVKPLEYFGVQVDATGNYSDCKCTDVTRCKSTLRVTEASLVAKENGEAEYLMLSALLDMKPYLEAWSHFLEHRVHHITVDKESSDFTSKTFTVEAYLLGDNDGLIKEFQLAISNLTDGEDGLPQVGAIGGFNFTESNDFYLEDHDIFESLTTANNNIVKRESGVRKVEELTVITTRDPYLPPPTKKPQHINMEGRDAPLPTAQCSKLPPPAPPRHAHYNIEDDAVFYLCKSGYGWDAMSSERICDGGAWGHGYKPCVHCTVDGWNPVSLEGEVYCTKTITKKKVGNFDWMYPNAYIVTVPAFFGLVVLILCCICCTRLNSPLYHICRDKEKDALNKVLKEKP